MSCPEPPHHCPELAQLCALSPGTTLTQCAPAQAEKLVASGKAVFVDVRPAFEYEAQHLPGAINVPLYQAMETTGFYADVKRCATTGGGPRGLRFRRHKTLLPSDPPRWHSAGMYHDRTVFRHNDSEGHQLG